MSTPGTGDDEQPGSAALEGREPGRPRGRLRLGHTLAATGLLGLLIGGSALADKGDALREAVRNGTATGETEIIGDIAASPASKGGYGSFQVGSPTGAPFTTNGAGLVQNLNADKVDGKDADELGGGAPGPAGPAGPAGAEGPTGPAGPGAKWALVKGDGTILKQSGGISIAFCGPAGTNNLNHAFVRTFNTAGAGTDHAFYITAAAGS
jgi:hypothetical protein